MNLYRNTYAMICLAAIKSNVNKVIKTYNNYDYYFGVVKADCYGHYGNKVVEAIINGGCNYLIVELLEEALLIRKNNKYIPILCVGVILPKYIEICIKNNITITVNSMDFAKEITKKDISKLKVHVKVNTGMNRLGLSSKNEFREAYNLLLGKTIIEGIYTHIYNPNNKRDTNEQFNCFKNMINEIDYKKIPIIHIAASDTIIKYSKPDYVNGCRFGIIMYGFTDNKKLNLESTFSVHSQIIQINKLKKGKSLGYNGLYVASKDEKIGVVSIGYADGIIRKNTGRNVFINNKEYKIIGNICMDMLFVRIDDSVKLYDEVLVLKDIEHIKRVAKHLETIPYEVMCSVGKRVKRIYSEKKRKNIKEVDLKLRK